MLRKLDDAVSIIDTEALGTPNVVAAYLISGAERCLIDMGYESSAKIIVEDLAEAGVGSEDVDYLLPTHVHLDHCGSCGTLARVFNTASIRVHPKGEPHLVDPSRLWNSAKDLFGDELMARYGRPEPVDKKRLRVANDGDVIDLGRGIVLRAVWTPGHASHHLSYEWEGRRSFLTGDAVGLYHPDFPVLVPTTPPTSFDLEKALHSLEVLRNTSPKTFYTPHYGVVGNAERWIEENVKSLLLWRDRLKELKRSGLADDAIVKAMEQDTCERIGRPVSEMPESLLVSIKISVLGFLQYLGR